MKLKKGFIFYPKTRNSLPVKWLCICAHQDDAEIMAVDGILKGYNSSEFSFALSVSTDGGGSSRSGDFKNYSDGEMKKVRIEEQKAASEIGRYNSVYFLNYSSKEMKDKNNKDVIEDYVAILKELRPEVIYTHSLLDKHPTHVAVAVKVIDAIRQLDSFDRPKVLFGCEVWRGLDWISDDKKIGFDLSKNIMLQKSLLDVHKSQIAGGKEYTKASLGRRYQNATYYQSHNVDSSKLVSYAIDMSELIKNNNISLKEYALSFTKELHDEVSNTIDELWK